MTNFEVLLYQVNQCQYCAAQLTGGVRPVVQLDPQAKVLIIGQAPGRKVHETGIPFNDASGDRLREWLGVSREVFYDAKQIAIMPMGFCYPGSYTAATAKKGQSGDLPPRPECAPKWHSLLLAQLTQVQLVLLVGQYAQQYYLSHQHLTTNELASSELTNHPLINKPKTLTETVKQWRSFGPHFVPLPHPSPRNNIWLSRNPWFEQDVLSHIQQRVRQALA
ncbi:uracil-DNA glycosylase family protein [Shewanella ulleungensis]|jgi:uracil-DNA glycosylase|uniref:IclR family transcriptional regulator n=1 Tax=Shewanella ulleungensis TaxID=2282699 RepID=A0ABQ2QGN4_9GAMM|nr:uracil-DNA glycosylase family protein [Shewanella ulleungensis]MCL1149568.1 uracil-DNA glycosylase family protein [Shewanella ulleungensis]GGP79949.1 IclR family transcriptional regulator [Shewanella ulleungensis]